MKIDLNKEEVRKILVDKFGEAFFRVFYTESDESFKSRTGRDYTNLKETPEKESYLLFFD